jgi:hypothetical protein
MSRRCKPGQRARIIGRSTNAGRVVVVVRFYTGELINRARWPEAVFPWVVTSLGAPLDSVDIPTQRPCPPAMTIVVDDSELQPLADDGDEFESLVEVIKPTAVGAEGGAR